MRNPKLCWYCEEKPRVKRKGALFCKECENTPIKEVNKPEQENYYQKV